MDKGHYNTNTNTNVVLRLLNSNLSDIVKFIEADDEVEDKDWTPEVRHDEEKIW